MTLVEVSDIATMLGQRIEALCADILPAGRREGSEWVDAKRAAGGLGDSMRVNIGGSKRGLWAHFANSAARGDALDLVAYVLFNDDKKKAIQWAKSWLGIDNADPARLKQQRAKARAVSKRQQAEVQKEREGKKRFAQSIWHNARADLSATPVDLYLLGRGICFSSMPRPPGALRYAEKLRHANGEYYPALVAQINNGAGEFIGVHRTFLHSPRPGVFAKAPLGEQAKMVLGPYAGGFISLNRGSSGKSLRDAPEGDHVVLCEGIEDGLSIVMECPERRVLACINVGNIKNIDLPETITTVTIAADNDAEFIEVDGEKRPHPARKSLQDAVDKFMDEGRQVFVAHSPHGKDFNDCLTHGEPAERVSQ